ncbi:pseudouridine synthase [Azotosporobacter soli]|uniref:pseudouridine synthase n=1 Tax=Azotosporobacter soli TaxID=3055040 RepID=UPI0031FED1E9
MEERLQKYISRSGLASRREAEQLILAGKVQINDQIVREMGVKVKPGSDKVTVNGKIIHEEALDYVLLYKPSGVVTTMSDPQGRPTVADLLTDLPGRLYPVGRLDYYTEGLLLMTNDGALTHALLHPSQKIYKTYLARVKGRPSAADLKRLRDGVELEDGLTAPAKVEAVSYDKGDDFSVIKIRIFEGKNRQIRRMCEAVGHPVQHLMRSALAFLSLEGLNPGAYRRLTPEELTRLRSFAVGPKQSK